MADKYPSISPYAYCAWNPVFIENALKAFAKTKLGYKELSKYAKAGQDILGVKFDKDDREIVDIINKGFGRTSIKIKQ